MRMSFVGGFRDGATFDVPRPFPPTMRLPVLVQPVASFSDEPPGTTGSFEVATYRLAYTVMDRRPYYVEEGVLERWGDIEHVVR